MSRIAMNGEAWSRAEVELLRQHYSDAPKASLLQMFPGRDSGSITAKASRLGLAKSSRWVDDHVACLRLHYPSASQSDLLQMFPGRSLKAIEAKATSLEIYRNIEFVEWTTTEIKILQKYYPITSRERMLILLPGRTIKSIRMRAHMLGIRKEKKASRAGYKVIARNNLLWMRAVQRGPVLA